MTLGEDARTKDVIHHLAGSVEASGGRTVAAEIRRDSNLDGAIRKTQRWFAGHCCLFIFDDVWCSNDIASDILVELSVLVNDCREKECASRLLYSTRDGELSLQGETVLFEPREAFGEEAKKILLGAAEAKDEQLEDEVCGRAILCILKKCAGLPVTLNVCGTSVKRMRRKWAGDLLDVWNAHWRKLERRSLVAESSYHCGSLSAALLVSLEFLDDRASSVAAGPLPRMSYRKMHRALCTALKQDWMPVSVVQELWDLEDEEETEDVVMEMVGVGVVNAEHRRVGDGVMMLGLRLHDLVHDFAQQEAKKHGEESMWPAAVLDVYHVGRCNEAQDPLWPVELNCDPDAGYMVRNVCGLLIQSSRFDEVEALLYSAQWSVKMLELSDVMQLEKDADLYLESYSKRCARAKRVGQSNKQVIIVAREESERSLRALCKILRQSLPYCAGNAHGAWFQLRTRLMGASDRPPWMQEMISEADGFAPRPWITAPSPCLTFGNDTLVNTYIVSMRCVVSKS